MATTEMARGNPPSAVDYTSIRMGNTNTAADDRMEPVSPAKSQKGWVGQTWDLLKLTWLDTLTVAGLIAVALGVDLITPRSAYVIKDQLWKISYPDLDNTVPAWAVPLYSILGPIVAFAVYRHIAKRSYAEIWRLILIFLTAVFLTGAITTCLKIPVGRLRPHFATVCWPDYAATGQIVLRDETSAGGYAVCSCSRDDELEARKSFPSGHTSYSAGGLGFFSYWLLGQLKAFAPGGSSMAWRLIVSLLPGLGAIAVAVTRVIDYWHFVGDVLTGLAIGYLVSLFVYRLYYPPFTHAMCDVPTYRLIKAVQQQQQQRGRAAGSDAGFESATSGTGASPLVA